MRLQLLSDLHLEFSPELELDIDPTVDAVIVAGDICSGTERGFQYLRRQVRQTIPIIAVAGNHEFYNRNWQEERARAHEAAPLYAIHWLDDGAVVLGGVRVLGSTLWTDYEIFGADKREQAMRAAGLGMSDHIAIKADAEPERNFSPSHALDAHRASVAFLDRAMAQPHDGPTVVVTHHGPHMRSIAPKFATSIITAAFISDLSVLIEMHQPAVWVHGHTHVTFDYSVGATRVLCNPHGYPNENRRFIPRLVVEL